MGWLGLGILEIQGGGTINNNLQGFWDDDQRKKGMEYIQKALKVDPNNYLAMRYMADHYFFTD